MPNILDESFFILIFLLLSFLSWISNKIRESRENRGQPRMEPPPDLPDEPRQEVPDRMRDILESMGFPVEPEPEPVAAPPPLPEQQTPPPEVPPLPFETKVEKPQLTREEQEALDRIQSAGEFKRTRRHRRSGGLSVKALLEPENVRSAFLLREILGPPRSMESMSDLPK